MSASARTLLSMTIAGALGGCQWIAGIEDTTVVRDAGQPPEDAARPAVDGSGGGGDRPDAAAPTDCPMPCVGDAVAEFAYEQGGISGVWTYVAHEFGLFGATYDELSVADRDGIRAWVGLDQGSPAIVHCPSSPDHASCEGVEDKLLLETTEPGVKDPALIWIVPENGPLTYRLSGDWRVPPNAIVDAPMTLLLMRNSGFEAVLDERFLTRELPTAFDFEVDVLPGDVLRLIAIAGDSARAPLAVSWYISEAQEPGRCQITTDFADYYRDRFPNLCGGREFKDNSDRSDTCLDPENAMCPATASAMPPPSFSGDARGFVAGASLEHLDDPNSYSGDFTVQFWAYLDGGAGAPEETVLADRDCATETGIGVYRHALEGAGASEIRFDAYYPDPMFDQCVIGPASITSSVSDDEWHFYRLTRATATNTISVCIDGTHVGDTFVPGDADMGATAPMWLGRDVTYNPAVFRGRIVELRVLGRALPCFGP
jgi:hypothetical protein